MAELRGPKALRFPPAITETPAVEPATDGYVVFTTNTRQQLDSFCLLIGRPELAEQYATAASRQIDWDTWNEIVHGWTTSRPADEILTAAAELRIPVA
ncbi:MAG: CoA transferase, partial [Actinobacteria bacterium]|nr:CoA transferase [Actinomycetota bacterium]NIS31298.1 CoA transferase [Actinomycetota bacterium]NIT95587.1 CoA transferase [Actinomycetota bacterium]NIU19280.1 CoA transferase [Actinomycetota bacterium]NIU66418.1 CoA transferase [Actinomycetota bacterium]